MPNCEGELPTPPEVIQTIKTLTSAQGDRLVPPGTPLEKIVAAIEIAVELQRTRN